MSHIQERKIYYKFELNKDFIPEDSGIHESRREWVIFNVINSLEMFIEQEKLIDGIQYENHKIVILSEDEEKVDFLQSFFCYLMDSGTLYGLTIKHFIERVRAQDFREELKPVYDYFKLSQALDQKPEEEKKKPKI